MNLKRIALLVFCCCITICSLATQHVIKLKFNGLKNASVLLAHYHANEKTKYALDTAFIDATGTGVFDNSRNLEQGIYLVILPDYKNIEFLIDVSQQFEIHADILPSPHNITFTNSPENTEFYVYKHKRNLYDSTIAGIILRRQQINTGTAELKMNSQAIYAKLEYDTYRNTVIKKYPSTFLEQLTSSNFMEVDYLYEKKDITIFKNIGFLNTPFFEKKLFYYLDTLLSQNRDTLKNNLTILFNNSMQSPELFRYLSSALLTHYRDKKDYEDIFMYVSENYYIPFVSWDSAEEMEKLQNEIAKLKPTMVGSEAQNIYLNKYFSRGENKTLVDTTFFKSTLYSINADYIIAVFWEEDCEPCRKDILMLYGLAQRLKDKKVVLLSMNMRTGKEEIASWLAFINKNKLYDCVNASPSSMYFKELYQALTPETIYIIDKNKKIMARKLLPAEVEKYLPSE